jgi:cytochrome oxidase Cu insertion factor (SCO1/SenC/PrrC family)
MLMRSKVLIGALVLLAAVSAALATVIVQRLEVPQPVATGTAAIGGPFALTDHTGRAVTERDFQGSWMLVYFGYTYCPDICPLGLQTVAQALDLLPPAVAEKVVPVFVTVDPERDTVTALEDYVGLFHPRLVGLTGTVEQIDAVKRAYRVYAQKAPGSSGPDYLVDHSTFTFLMGPDGAYVTHFGHGVTPEQLAAKVTGLVRPAT